MASSIGTPDIDMGNDASKQIFSAPNTNDNTKSNTESILKKMLSEKPAAPDATANFLKALQDERERIASIPKVAPEEPKKGVHDAGQAKSGRGNKQRAKPVIGGEDAGYGYGRFTSLEEMLAVHGQMRDVDGASMSRASPFNLARRG